MLTRTELSERLEALGITRDARTLTKWVGQGLLPSPELLGRGPDQGVARLWKDSVLHQAIAADYLMGLYHRADWVLLGLWHCGYPVSTTAAKATWIKYTQKDHERLTKNAAEYRDGFLGLTRRWGRRIPMLPGGHVAPMLDFMTELTDWQYNEDERDDEALKLRLAEIFSWFEEPMFEHGPPNIQLIDWIEFVWKVLNIPSFFRPAQSMEFIQSMTELELSIAQLPLIQVREMLEHQFTLTNVESIPLAAEIAPTRIMQSFIGPMLTKLLIRLSREAPELPVARSISTIHDYVMELELEDISREEKWQLKYSERASKKWQKTTKGIAEIWHTAVTEKYSP